MFERYVAQIGAPQFRWGAVPADTGTKVFKYTAGPSAAPVSIVRMNATRAQFANYAQQNATGISTPDTTVVSSALSDGSDTTYVEAKEGTGTPDTNGEMQAVFEKYTGPITGITRIEFFMRASASTAGTTSPVLLRNEQYRMDGGISVRWTKSHPDEQWIQIPTDGVIRDYSQVLDDSVLNDSGWDPTAGGGLHEVVSDWATSVTYFQSFIEVPGSPSPVDDRVRIYELWIEVQTGDPNAVPIPTEIVLKGPATESQGDAGIHHGVFALPSDSRSASFLLKVGSDTQCWARPMVEFGHFDAAGTFQVDHAPAASTVQISGRPEWTPVKVVMKAPDAAPTHYRVRLGLYSDAVLVTPLVENTEVFIDSIYVVENGLDPAAFGQGYLDGDTPAGTWEREFRNSTSVYGAKPPVPLTISLDEDLVMT